MVPPEHMNVAERNKRLYEYLKGLGLVVSPFCAPDRPDEIDGIVVSVALHRSVVEVTGLQPSLVTPPSVLPPLQGDEVGDVVTPSLGRGDNVVSFPPKV